MDPFVRLFLAVDPSAETRSALGSLQAAVKPRYPTMRWLDPAGMHLTLKFLGDVDANAVDAIRVVIAEATARSRACTVEITGVTAFPTWRSPRVLVALCSVPDALRELNDALQPAFEPWGIAAEARAFKPHLTLARNRDHRPSPLAPPEGLEVPPAPNAVTSLVLYASRLERTGPVYTPIASWPLQA